ncbi:MAG: hypothetical protein AAGE01_09975, partial [Pseudomonadota bacterium]
MKGKIAALAGLCLAAQGAFADCNQRQDNRLENCGFEALEVDPWRSTTPTRTTDQARSGVASGQIDSLFNSFFGTDQFQFEQVNVPIPADTTISFGGYY